MSFNRASRGTPSSHSVRRIWISASTQSFYSTWRVAKENVSLRHGFRRNIPSEAKSGCFRHFVGRVHFQALLEFVKGIGLVALRFEDLSQSNMGVTIEDIHAERATKRLFGPGNVLPAQIDLSQLVV